MGGSARKNAQTIQSQAAQRYSDLGSQLASEAGGQRGLVNDYYSSIIKGGDAGFKAIAPQVDFAKQQFANERRTLQNTVPAGGAFPGANRQLAAAEAGTVSNLYRDKISQALEGLSGYSQGTTGQALNAVGGASSAAQGLAQMAQSRSGSIASGLGGLAGLFGTYFGGGFGRRNSYPGTPPYVPSGGGGAGAYATGTQGPLS